MRYIVIWYTNDGPCTSQRMSYEKALDQLQSLTNMGYEVELMRANRFG